MKKFLSFCLVLLITSMLLYMGIPASATEPSTVSIKSLKNSISPDDIKEAEDAAVSVYESLVLEYLIEESGEGRLLLSSFSFEELVGASMSDPIPVFSSPERYEKGDEFSSRLRLNSWYFVVYVKDTPISVFSIVEEQGIYRFSSLLGQEFAINFNAAMRQLGTSAVLCVPAMGCLFLVSDDERVAVVNSLFDKTEYPLITFDELNAAATQFIWDNIEDMETIGGVSLMSYTFGDDSGATDNSLFSFNNLIIAISVAVVSIGAFFAVSKLQRKQSVGRTSL